MHATPSLKDLSRTSTFKSPVSNRRDGFHRSTSSVGHSVKRAPSVSKSRCYDRPGRKPAADFEPNTIKLHDKICKAHGGSNFATDWVLTAFKHGVNKYVLHRPLQPREVTAMNFPGGFTPRQVYDGFIMKNRDRYECGLCKEDKKTYWKAKKDALRHLCKFHFGLADVCKVWYVLPIPTTSLNWSPNCIRIMLLAEKICTAKAK